MEGVAQKARPAPFDLPGQLDAVALVDALHADRQRTAARAGFVAGNQIGGQILHKVRTDLAVRRDLGGHGLHSLLSCHARGSAASGEPALPGGRLVSTGAAPCPARSARPGCPERCSDWSPRSAEAAERRAADRPPRPGACRWWHCQ